jgi:hypothetical protein
MGARGQYLPLSDQASVFSSATLNCLREAPPVRHDLVEERVVANRIGLPQWMLGLSNGTVSIWARCSRRSVSALGSIGL